MCEDCPQPRNVRGWCAEAATLLCWACLEILSRAVAAAYHSSDTTHTSHTAGSSSRQAPFNDVTPCIHAAQHQPRATRSTSPHRQLHLKSVTAMLR